MTGPNELGRKYRLSPRPSQSTSHEAGGERRAGPPAYAAQLWLANALLAVTFPFLVIHAAFFHFWPLQKGELAAGAAVDQREASVQ
jgi:hypothetical protein